MISRLLGATSRLLAALSDRDYVGLERLTRSSRFTAAELRELVSGSGIGPIQPPPSWADSQIELRRLDSTEESWRVRLPLWSRDTITDVVLTFTVVVVNRSLVSTLEDLSSHADFSPAPDAVPPKEIAAAVGEVLSRHSALHRPPPGDGEHDLEPGHARALTRFMQLLVDRQFEQLAREPGGMTAEAIQVAFDDYHQALGEYDEPFVMPPEGMWPDTEVGPEQPDGWRPVEMFLWTLTGQSELCVYPELRGHGDEIVFRLYDLRVP